ncbi:MAG: DUF4145 domain-containing protein [Solirubrobacteraceae bacterium]
MASDVGVTAEANGLAGILRACPSCGYPSYIDTTVGIVTPPVSYGTGVADLPSGVGDLYEEARDCVSVAANHAAVMVCRKILMHVAVLQGAAEGKSFVFYVDYLVENHLVPPRTKDWVDEIRQIGNDATHEIFDIDETAAKAAVDFVAMLLKLLYEFPAKGAASVAARAAKDAAAATPAGAA